MGRSDERSKVISFYACNGTGKTRLSIVPKDAGEQEARLVVSSLLAAS